ncbi:MAG: DUF1622 domain-containing protein [Ignavibacteria bacterium]|nr:DUF1622 domain-containing protein [Ignavibacteria bacterium]
MTEIIENVASYISALSFIVIAYGSLLAILRFIQNELSRVRGRFSFKKLNSIKINFSYYLLLGLDFLIAADVIRTIVENTLQDLAILGASVLIRTILAFFLGREMKEDNTLRKDFETGSEP